MKNLFLAFLSILLMLFFTEIIVRYTLPQDMTGSLLEFSDRGYWLNKSFGVSQEQVGNILFAKYHYYPPHLRDTPLDDKLTPILVLGDSYTFGMYLASNQTYVHQLQVKADNILRDNKYQFLNAATRAWGLSDYVAYLEEFGAIIKPKFVLIFLSTDDVGRAIKKDIYTLPNIDTLQLKENFHPLPHAKLKKILAVPFYNWLLEHSALVQIIRNSMLPKIYLEPLNRPINTVRIPFSMDLTFQDKFAIHLAEALFIRMNTWCVDHHAKLIVITTGFNAFYPNRIHDPTQVFLSKANAFFKEENIPYYDMALPFKNAVKNRTFTFFPIDHHENELGAKIIAELSWPFLKKQLVNEA